MSVRVMTAVWDITLADSEKIVLLALADCANDEGWCWPGMKSLARKCSKTDRTVQASIKALCAAGHLTRIEVSGTGCRYQVHPRSDFTPEATSPPKPFRGPPKPVRDTPEAASDKPSKNHKYPSGGSAGAPPATSPDGNEGDQDQGEAPAAGAAGGKKPQHQPQNKPMWAAHVLPDDWVPPAVADLPTATAAMVRQWPAGAYAQTADNFRDHWSAVDRKRRTPAGHAAAFRNWLGRLHPEMIRAAKAGVSFAAPTAPAGGAGVHRAPPGPVAAKAIEDERSQAIHARLRATLGNAIWQQWFAPAAMLVGKDGQAITVVAPSAFHRDWIERCFAAPLSQAARAVLGADAGPVCLEVADQAGAAELAADRLPNGKITSSEQGERQHG